MKKILVFVLILQGNTLYSQIFLKNIQGEPIFSPTIKDTVKNVLLNLNTGNQSISFDYFFTNKPSNPANFFIFRFGVSAKPNEGVAALLNKGQFSPGVKFSGSITKIPFLANKVINKKFDDWITFNLTFDFDKYKLYKVDTNFKSQLYDQNFKGFSPGFDYNLVLGRDEVNYLNFKAGYTRKTNLDELTTIEVKDIKFYNDSSSGTQRQRIITYSAREGIYKEFDAWPISISYTRLPKYQDKYLSGVEKKPKYTTVKEIVKRNSYEIVQKDQVLDTIYRISSDTVTRVSVDSVEIENPNYKSLKIGYSIYLNTIASQAMLPQTKIGFLVFLVNPNKDGVLIPRLGINLQLNDPFDVKRLNNGLIKKVQIGLTANISL